MAKINSRDLRLFNRNVFPLIPFVVLFFLCLVLMATDYRKQILKKIKKEAFVISSPITYLINLPVKIFRDSKDNFITKKILQEKIINLEQTNYELSIKAQENKLLASENKLLRNSLKIYKDFNMLGVHAEIILPTVKNGHSVITINRGLKNNIEAGSAVINNRGLVGQIINISKSYSEIRPITSESYAVPAIIDNGKENVILFGNGNGELEIPLFPASSSIKINDNFVTSGTDNLYPKGIYIGRVTEIKTTNSPKFNSIIVTPFSQPTTFSQITVLDIKK
ncbi:rod shape-determining protein MreC [Methylophilaceae bacterium]|jgi:rod shape-determining protein MreC|nr:rod shape-determining protein MreC [Methylophilaceae bacterium]|tara:strand:- start:13713 stop:14552 length:840 start_codon:yes stop_codon:yes gene_type:complete